LEPWSLWNTGQTFKPRHVIVTDDSSIGDDNVATFVWRVLHGCLKRGDLLLPVGDVASDELSLAASMN
jgi:hypothetical protein